MDVTSACLKIFFCLTASIVKLSVAKGCSRPPNFAHKGGSERPAAACGGVLTGFLGLRDTCLDCNI